MEESNYVPEWENLERSSDLERDLRGFENKAEEGQLESTENPEIQNQSVEPEEQPVTSQDERWRPITWDIPVIGPVVEAAEQLSLGVGDFMFDAVGLVPWVGKPIENWWDSAGYRSNHPVQETIRNASSLIIPSLYGGGLVTQSVKGSVLATKAATLPSYVKTLGTVSAYAGVDTGVAMISSHSKTDDNMAAVLNEWLGWEIPWATRAGDSPDVRWKKNVMEAAGFTAGVEVLGAAFSFARKTRLIGRDAASKEIIQNREVQLSLFDNPLTEAVESSIDARSAAQQFEMKKAIEADPNNINYNAFVHDVGPDDAGRAVINTQPDPLMAKVNHTQIQNNIDTLHGRAAAVVDEAFNDKFVKSISGNERARLLDDVFTRISPTFDAVVDGKTITAEQMNRSVDNLTNAIFGADLPLKEFEFIVDDMKATVFNSNQFLDEEQWTVASLAFKNAYETLFDPNQMRASAMITQQAADNVADTAAAVKMLGDNVDTTRQHKIIFEKLNLLGQEVQTNKFIVEKAREYRKLKSLGDQEALLDWMAQAGPQFDDFVRHTKRNYSKLGRELSRIAEEAPEFYKPFIEAYDATNGKVDDLAKLHRLAQNNIGFIKKAFVDLEPGMPSQLVQQIRAARINGLLSGLAPMRALVGNTTMTLFKPASIFAGAYMQGDKKLIQRSQYVFGAIDETFRRGLKVMRQEWDRARLNPEEAMMRGRADLRQSKLDELEYMDSMAEAWRQSGKAGDQAKIALWNVTKGLSWWNNNQFVRWGTNALYAIDGMTNSIMATGMARAKAWDEMAQLRNGSVDVAELASRERELYANAFDSTGLLTDTAAKHASQEIALNLDNEMVHVFDKFLDYVPAARGIFLFPRTGINATALAWSFNPLSSLPGLALPKVRRVFNAVSDADIKAVLKEHGISDPVNQAVAFQTLKSEYIGRQIMGNTVVMGAGLWALQGNMTGSGPQDGAERARMQRMGWRPWSIKNPITGEWRSYEGFEPFASVMGMTADAVYHARRVDQSVTEDWFRKISASISLNVSNNTFVSGFEPLVGLLTGDPTAWSRFFAQQADQGIPLKGIRSILNNAISPQLRDVNNDILGYLMNGNKFLFNEEQLPNMLDVYTGQPVRGYESITQAFNAILPMFKQNGDMEPWRQWLLSTGWDGLQKDRINPYTKEPLSPRDRQYINNWIAKNAHLKSQIIAMMSEDDGYWNRKLKEYVKARGIKSQREFPIKQTIIHRELDRIHDLAFKNAWIDLKSYNEQYGPTGSMIRMRQHQLRSGDTEGALETQNQIRELQRMYK